MGSSKLRSKSCPISSKQKIWQSSEIIPQLYMPPYIISQQAISHDQHIPSYQFHSLFYIIHNKMIFALNNTHDNIITNNQPIIHNKKESRNYRKYHYKNKKKQIPFIF